MEHKLCHHCTCRCACTLQCRDISRQGCTHFHYSSLWLLMTLCNFYWTKRHHSRLHKTKMPHDHIAVPVLKSLPIIMLTLHNTMITWWYINDADLNPWKCSGLGKTRDNTPWEQSPFRSQPSVMQTKPYPFLTVANCLHCTEEMKNKISSALKGKWLLSCNCLVSIVHKCSLLFISEDCHINTDRWVSAKKTYLQCVSNGVMSSLH